MLRVGELGVHVVHQSGAERSQMMPSQGAAQRRAGLVGALGVDRPEPLAFLNLRSARPGRGVAPR